MYHYYSPLIINYPYKMLSSHDKKLSVFNEFLHLLNNN